MKINRLFNRSLFYFFKFLLKPLSLINHRVFMFFYCRLLEKNGMNLYGKPRYIGFNVVFDDFDLISLSDRVVISDECHFLTHDYSITTILLFKNYKLLKDVAINRGIFVGKNVFIGKKSLILPNTVIQDNVIIGAGSVVRGNLESGYIYSGNPAIKIKSFDSQYDKWLPLLNSNIIRFDS